MSPIHALRHMASRRSGGHTARLPLWLAMTTLSCALLAPLALAASPAWALTVGTTQSVPGASVIEGVACPVTTVCEAVGQNNTGQGVVGVVTNGIAGAAQAVPGAGMLNGVACSSATTCEAVGQQQGQGVVVTITNGVAGAAQVVPGSLSLLGVACPTSVTCVAVGVAPALSNSTLAVLVVLTNGVPGAPQIFGNLGALDAIACSDATTCVAGGRNSTGPGASGVLMTVANGTPGAVQTVAGSENLAGLACYSASDCEAVGWSRDPMTGVFTGVVDAIANGVGGVPQQVPSSRVLDAVACPSPGQCLAVGDNPSHQMSVVMPLTGVNPGTAIGVPVDELFGVACPSTTSCDAVGVENNVIGVVIALTNVTTTKATPTMSTAIVPTPPVTASQAFHGSATLSGGASASGNITFQTYSDAACSTALSSPDTIAVNGDGTYVSHDITSGVGTIWLRAVYSGDTNNNSVMGACQPVQIVQASPTISSQASAGGPVGTQVSDHATLSGGASPTGKVSFTLFSDAACTTQVFSSTNDLAGASATSDSFTPTTAGTYYWTATYGGDANNASTTSACNAPNESVTITPVAPPTFTRTITGIFVGPLVVNAGDSVQVLGARVTGAVTVNPGGALSVTSSQIAGTISADAPKFLILCGNQIAPTLPAPALALSNATGAIQIGDPSNRCAGNQFGGDVNLTKNAALTFATNLVSKSVNVNNGGPGKTTVSANRIYGALACAGDNPAPINGGQVNVASAKTGQCAGL